MGAAEKMKEEENMAEVKGIEIDEEKLAIEPSSCSGDIFSFIRCGANEKYSSETIVDDAKELKCTSREPVTEMVPLKAGSEKREQSKQDFAKINSDSDNHAAEKMKEEENMAEVQGIEIDDEKLAIEPSSCPGDVFSFIRCGPNEKYSSETIADDAKEFKCTSGEPVTEMVPLKAGSEKREQSKQDFAKVNSDSDN